MKLNDEFIVTIDNMDYQGRGIARVNGITIFVENALPKEQVKIKIKKIKKNIAEAIVLEFLKESSVRVKPQCPYYSLCGGCDLMHLKIEEQNQYKELKIKELMIRYGNVEIEKIKPMIKNEQPLFYRNKVTFQVKEKIGFYRKKSYDIISIDSCLIADDKINEILKVLKTLPLKNVSQIIVRSSKYTSDTMVVIECFGKIEEKTILESLKPYVSSLIVKNEIEKVLYGNSVIYEKMKDKIFAISPSSFFQVNTNQAIKLYEKALEYANLHGKEKVLDLYCGTGTIGIFMSDYAKEVVGIELNESAIENAKKNAELNHTQNVTFLCGDASKQIDHLPFKPDVIIVDPPRSGLSRHVIDTILKLNPNKIVYISCDPMTLARDLVLLEEKYNVLELTPVDLFTETYHVECVCVLNRH